VTVATVHVLDDDPAVLRSLGRLLGSVGYRTKLYDSAFALLDAASDITGCILLDIRMPDLDGLEVHDRLWESECPVILMTGHADVEMAVEVLKSGAADFLEKPFSEEKLLSAIAAALQKANERPVQEVARRAAARLAKLSPRERQVLDALVRGEAHKVIAHRLGISVRTVELHRARMLQRLGTRHLAYAIKLAVLAGLAPDSAELPTTADR
jgi:two-component system response regulator FixJ